MRIRDYIFRSGCLFIIAILAYYSLVAGDWIGSILFMFYASAVTVLTFGDLLKLKI